MKQLWLVHIITAYNSVGPRFILARGLGEKLLTNKKEAH